VRQVSTFRLLFGRHPEPRLPGKVVESQSEVAFVHNEFLSSKLAQAYFFSGGEPMIRRQHSNKGFPVNGNNLDSFYFFDRQRQKSYIHGAILDHSDLITGEDISKGEFDVRIELAKSPHEMRHDLLSGCRDESNANAAEPARGRPLSFLACHFQLFQSNGSCHAALKSRKIHCEA
jgi:hypothetical protein